MADLLEFHCLAPVTVGLDLMASPRGLGLELSGLAELSGLCAQRLLPEPVTAPPSAAPAPPRTHTYARTRTHTS